MNKLYHITPKKNIISILQQGLYPAGGKGICVGKGRKDHVFLTNDIDRIVSEQAGERWIRQQEAIVLEVDIRELSVVPYEYTYRENSKSDFEFVCDHVPPEVIQVNKRYNYE